MTHDSLLSVDRLVILIHPQARVEQLPIEFAFRIYVKIKQTFNLMKVSVMNFDKIYLSLIKYI